MVLQGFEKIVMVLKEHVKVIFREALGSIIPFHKVPWSLDKHMFYLRFCENLWYSTRLHRVVHGSLRFYTKLIRGL